MVKTLFIFLLSLHLVLILADTVKNFSLIFPDDFLIKVLPLALMIVLTLLDLLFCDELSWRIRLSSYLLASNAITLNTPSTFDHPKGFLVCFIITLAFFLTFLVLNLSGGLRWIGADILPLGVAGLLLLQNIYNGQENDAIAPFDLPLVLGLVAALILFICAEGKADSPWLLPAISFALYFLLVYVSVQKYNGGFYWLSGKKTLKRVRNISPETFKTLNEMSRMDELFARVEKYMIDEQPYLREDLTQAELARVMLTNKTYLSRTINTKSGKNFCTYINWYRINYSLKIIEKDTRVKVVELAVMSGFHSVASYNMAFRLFTGDTPSEYIRTQKAKALEKAHTPFHDEGTGAVT